MLDPYDGDEVLEIGTGAGWTAGLLAHELGGESVTSVEIDAAVHVAAVARLDAIGLRPRLVLGDGTAGVPEGAPYDRVHVTAGVREVPYAWVEQTRPGGVIVFPWMPGWEGGHRTALTVAGDGSAVGRFHGGCAFMLLRGQRPPAPERHGQPRQSSTALDPRRVVQASTGADVAIAGMIPDLFASHASEGDGSFDLWLWTDDADAHVHYAPDYKYSSVSQSGNRDLWDELSDAFFKWVSWGSPTRDRFGLTVSPHGQSVWLDTPADPITP